MPKNYFYFKVPFRIHLSLNEAKILSDTKGYKKLLGRIKNANIKEYLQEKDLNFCFPHLDFKDDALQFESVEADSSMNDVFSPSFLEIQSPDWFDEIIMKEFDEQYEKDFGEKDQKKLIYQPNSCKIVIYRNTFATIEFVLEMKQKTREADHAWIKKLENCSNAFSGSIIQALQQSIIEPLLTLFKSKEEKNNLFFNTRSRHLGFPDLLVDDDHKSIISQRTKLYKPLWVSRVMVIANEDNEFEAFFQRWVLATASKQDILENIRNENGDEKSNVYLGWMNSIMRGDIQDTVIQDAFFALGLAQYYYTIFDSLNQSLSQLIGLAGSKDFSKNSKAYKELLEEMINVTDLISVNHADIIQGMQPNRTYFFMQLKQHWTLDNIIDNVQRKIVICKENSTKIDQKRFNHSQRAAEILLFFISGFAILDFLSGLAQYIFKPDSINQDVWGIYNLVKWAEPNTMMWFGLAFFVSVLVFYLMHQNKKG